MKIITYPELKKMYEKHEKILLADIREYEEYMEHHINNAVNIPEEKFMQIMEDEDEMFKEILNMYRNGYNIILYCARGNSSMLIAEKMDMYKLDVYSLYGGIDEYDRYMRYEKSVWRIGYYRILYEY